MGRHVKSLTLFTAYKNLPKYIKQFWNSKGFVHSLAYKKQFSKSVIGLVEFKCKQANINKYILSWTAYTSQ